MERWLLVIASPYTLGHATPPSIEVGSGHGVGVGVLVQRVTHAQGDAVSLTEAPEGAGDAPGGCLTLPDAGDD